MNHTVQRHRRLYGLLNETGTFKHRHDLVCSFTDGRSENSSDLTDMEADQMIRHLEAIIKDGKISHVGVDRRGQQMRRRILSLCYNIGWTEWDYDDEKPVVDFERLDNWMLKYGHLHKKLNEYTYEELPTLVTQFENMAKSFLTGSDE